MLWPKYGCGGRVSFSVDSSRCRLLVFFVAGCLAWCSSANSQTSSAPTFDKIMQYATTFADLNERTESNYSELARVLTQIAPLTRNLEETANDLRGIEGFKFEIDFRQQSALATADANDKETSNLIAKGVIDSTVLRLNPGGTYLASVATLAGQARAEAHNLEQIRAQLSIAMRTTVERRLKILDQLQSLGQQAETYASRQKQYIDEYIQHADCEGLRSRLELRAGLHVLQGADRDNAAAALARGISLMRLGRNKEAENALDDLVKLPDPISTVALAARAELLSRANRNKESKRDIGLTMNSQNPTVVLLRARAWAIMGMNSDALKNWEQLAKFKSHQHFAWSSQALMQCSGNPNPNVVRKALEQTQLANDLSGGTDWYAKLSFAFARAANKELPQAAEAAVQAADLTMDDKRQLCLKIAEKFRAGQIAKFHW